MPQFPLMTVGLASALDCYVMMERLASRPDGYVLLARIASGS